MDMHTVPIRCGIALAMALTLTIPAFAATTKSTSSDKYGVRISYPADWIDKGTSAWDLLNPDYSGTYNTFGVGPAMEGEVMVSVIPSAPKTLKEFVASLNAIMTAMDPALKVGSSKEITVSGMKGFDVTYGQGTEYGRTRVVAFYQNGKRYTIAATGFDSRPGMYDSYAPAIESVVQSFRILP